MTPAKREQLDRLIDRIAKPLGIGADPAAIIDALVRGEGARLRFTGGAYELRLAGVVGIATSGRKAALESWMRAALRRIAREAGR